MDEQQDYTQYYHQLRNIYQEKYPHNPNGVLYHHIIHKKNSIEASILLLATENNIQIPEIQTKIAEGATP